MGTPTRECPKLLRPSFYLRASDSQPYSAPKYWGAVPAVRPGDSEEALDKLARAVDERFFGQSRQKKWRNTRCISHFF